MPCLYCGSQLIELSDSLYCSFCGFSLNFPYTTWEIVLTINDEQMRILREEEPSESQLDFITEILSKYISNVSISDKQLNVDQATLSFNLELSVILLEEKLTEVLREHLSDSPFTMNSIMELVSQETER